MEVQHSILIVDDNDDIRDLLSVSLTASGYRVVSAADGEDALRIIRSSIKIDLILSDIQMPNLNGIELALRRKREFPDIPLILMSGLLNIANSERKALSVNAFIPKPFSLDFVKSCVADCIEIHRLAKLSA